MSMPPAPSQLHFRAVLSESKRIINAHSRHFLALSVIFLLPLSFSLIVYPTLQQLLTDSVTNESQILFLVTYQDQPINTKTLLLPLAYIVFVFIFSLCAVGTISYSVIHAFYGRPVKLISAIKSILSSFFPLLITFVVSQIIIFFITVVFGMLLFFVIIGIEFLGFQIDYSSPYFIGFLVMLLLVLLIVLVYLQVNWTLVCVIAVVESSWGLEPLRRSKSLIKGVRGVALTLLLFFGSFAGILMLGSLVSAVGSDGIGDGWKSWAFVVQIVVTSAFLVLLMLYNAAANTVLYMYCKAIHGELAMEIAEEFSKEYVSLPFDDGKVPHVVSVACI